MSCYILETAKSHEIFSVKLESIEKARPPSIESGQAFDLKMIDGLLYDLYVTLHPQDCDAVLYEESEAA